MDLAYLFKGGSSRNIKSCKIKVVELSQIFVAVSKKFN